MTTGTAWVARTTAQGARAVASNGTILVAVGYTSTPGVMTSPDGITWSGPSASAPAGNGWSDVLWAAGLGLFVAVGNGLCMTSPNGTTWTQRTIPSVAAGWSYIAWSGSLLVATGQTGQANGGQIATSPDGITWTQRSSGGANENGAWQGIAWNGAVFAATTNAAPAANKCVITSPDGITWTLQSTADSTASGSWTRIFAAPGGQLLLVSNSTGVDGLMTSADSGVSWTRRTRPGDVGNSYAHAAWCTTNWVMVGYGTDGQQVMTSSDGVTWTAQAAGIFAASPSWAGVCSHSAAMVVAVSG